MSNTTTTKGAVKGTVAAAAGVAVLLGGAGTFALWNAEGAIGTASTATGSLTATFGDTVWTDDTPGAENAIPDIGTFVMVPGDVVVGTADVDVTAVGENLRIDTGLDYADGTLPDDVDVSVVLTDGADAEVTRLSGSNAGTTHDLTATVTLRFDESATGSMSQEVNLNAIAIDLQQVAPGAP